MSLHFPNNLGPLVSSQSEAVGSDLGKKTATKSNIGISLFEGSKEHIRKVFDKVQLSVSAYDTAWVAMVPSTSSIQTARFPQCVNWLLNNQLLDGSWGLPDRHHLLMKDALLSTLACIVALKQWGVGERQIEREQAKYLNLNLPLRQSDLDVLLRRRNKEVKRCLESFSEGSRAYLSYISEGMGKLQDWEMVIKYKRKDGSICNSPSATAAALSNLQNSDCLRYINALLEKLGDAVPAVYPLEIYSCLQLIDNLEKLGIHRHFQDEIGSALVDIYKCWMNGEEEIFQDVACLAMAFRILRSHGYGVSSDALSQFAEEGGFCKTLEGYLMDMRTVLELYRASQMIIYQDDIVLEKLHNWTSCRLKERIANSPLHADRLEKHVQQEMDLALKFSNHANLEQFVNRRNIEHYNTDNTRILKSAFRYTNIGNKVLLNLAKEDFNKSQAVHQEELKHLARWVTDKRLDKLKFARQKLAYCYFSAAAALPAPALSDARIAWAKNGVLTTVVDDFFDVGGSRLELDNLIKLIEKWDVDVAADCCSENVKIIFLALQSSICEIGDRAIILQGRNVKAHVAEIWLDLLKSMLKEAEWSATKSVPQMDEYMANGLVSFALGPIVLPTLYLIGPKLSEDAVRSTELLHLFELMSTCGRLLNDIQGFKRESEQGKLNAVSLQMTHGGVSKKEAINSTKDLIASNRRELLKRVLGESGVSSIVPRACRYLFWKMSTVLHLFYMEEDGFTSQKMADAVKDLLERPIILNDQP
ncbi:hypothetical protein CRG98_016777 [Punica granatum]|uniref:Ent-kaur-16-ene synthase, chloroplastic n=1 Tax=Punica granatum TaxID=22663 RepID=A0A2I0K544_PUNGR|nr:hypothetical protein CRG98_016777 [Punica granatum]